MSQNDYPIILAHGLARFDILRELALNKLRWFLPDFDFTTDRLHYFRGIRSYLTRHGFEVYVTNVDFVGDLDKRAHELGQQIQDILDKTDHRKVHIIGHSMGGLDSRNMIFHNYSDMARKVASVTSIGTPHLGTSVADYGLAHGGDEAIEFVKVAFNWDFGGFQDITLEARQEFNEEAENNEATNNVFYQTYAAGQELEKVFSPIQYSWQIIKELEGDDPYNGANDGLVSVNSQFWHSELTAANGTTKKVVQHHFPLSADHINEIGWWDLNELETLRWWQFGKLREKRRYETAVKEIYLQIARDVSNL